MNDEINTSDWCPSASIEMLKRRSELLSRIRHFFAQRDVMEVETPILSRYGNPDPNIESISIDGHYLHTSPEFAMKRLLAAGSGSIFQICKVFRKAESGKRHNPEFTMLEWYRMGFDYQQLMDEVVSLLNSIGLTAKSKKLTYAQLFQHYLGLDIHQATVGDLRRNAETHGISVNDPDALDWDAWCDLLLSHVIEPQLMQEGIVIVYDFPASQAALAQIREGSPDVAQRFEVYVKGVEIANGYQELLDADLQQRRWQQENQKRQDRGQASVAFDQRMIAALHSGVESCAGIALGVDRLLMVKEGVDSIAFVLSFDNDRA